MRPFTALAASIVEAWGELRVARTRVLLSLIGVAVAVAALTGVVAFGQIAEQSQVENFERQSGRPAALSIYVANPTTGETPPAATLNEVFADVAARYDIRYASRNQYVDMSIQFADGVRPVGMQVVDQPFGDMHRIRMEEGAWWRQLGSPPLATHPTVELPGQYATTGVIVGVIASSPLEDWPSGYLLTAGYERLGSPQGPYVNTPNYEMWVPPELAPELTDLVKRDIAGGLGEGWMVDVQRSDYLAWQGEDPLLILKLVIGGVAGLVLLLGALGLLNISLVTVRYRIREIGIRRSFGATAGRVFFSVMMESVVATVVAGVVGVGLAIFALKNPWVAQYVSNGVDDVPPFPVEAALFGLAAATLVGALAGLLPALVAVRVKVIDAIRY